MNPGAAAVGDISRDQASVDYVFSFGGAHILARPYLTCRKTVP